MSEKTKKIIGLVVLTVVVVALIFLVIYLVEKNDREKKLQEQLKNAHIGETLACDGFEMKIASLDTLTELDGLKAADGKCFLLIEVTANASKDVVLSASDFTVKDAKAVESQDVTYDFIGENLQIKAQETADFFLLFEAEKGRIDSYYLTCYGYRIDLGGTFDGPVLSSEDVSIR